MVAREQRVDEAGPHAGITPGEARDFQREDQPHYAIVEQRAGARGVGQDDVALQVRQLVAWDARRRELADAGIDAVDRRIAAGDTLHDR